MAVTHGTEQVRQPLRLSARNRATALLVAVALAAVGFAAVRLAADQPVPVAPTAARSGDLDATRDLVNRGLVPSETLQPLGAEDAALGGLVNRGLVPRQALDEADRGSETAATRDLVNRGLVPAAAIEEG